MIVKRKVIGYVRVSTQQQEATPSLDTQSGMIKEWCSENGHELLGIYEDVGSARADESLKNLPDLQQAIAHANCDGAVIVVTRLDRLSRNTDEAERIATLVKEGIISIDDTFARANVRSKATILKAVSVAEKEADELAHRTKQALQKIAASGKKLGSPSAGKKSAATASAKVRRNNADIAVEEIARVLAESEENKNLTTRELMVLLNSRKFYSGSGRKWTLEGLRKPRRKAFRLLQEQAEMDAEEDAGPFASAPLQADGFAAPVSAQSAAGAGQAGDGAQTRQGDSGAATDAETESEDPYAKHPLYGLF